MTENKEKTLINKANGRRSGRTFFYAAILATAVILTACKKGDDIVAPEITPTAMALQATSAPTATPKPTATPVPTATPTPTPEPTPTPTPALLVQDVFSSTGYSGGYVSNIDFGDNVTNCDVNMVGSTPVMIVYTWDEDVFFYSVDVEHDKRIMQNYGASQMYSPDFMHINDDIFAVCDYTNSCYDIYDTKLIRKGKVEFATDYESAIMNTDGSTMYYLDEDGLKKRNYGDKDGELLIRDASLGGGYVDSMGANTIIIPMFDDCDGSNGTLIYDIENNSLLKSKETIGGLFTSPDGTETLYVKTGPYCEAGLYEGPMSAIFDAEEGLLPKTVMELTDSSEVGVCFTDWTRRLFLTSETYYATSGTIFELRAYSVDSGKKVAEYAMNAGDNSIWPALTMDEERGLVFFTTGNDGVLHLYAWDYANDTADDTESVFVKHDTIPSWIEEKRRDFEERYGMSMYLGSEVFASEFDYRLTICQDWQQVSDAIDVLDEVFANYPEGLFEQLKFDGIRKLAVYLCNGFEKQYSYSADDAIALACYFNYERALALDLNYSYCLKRTIIHEISHWIDGRIESASYFGKCTDYEEQWKTVNPEGYNYKNSYVSGSTKWKYIYDYADKEDAYFCDDYSQTYPGEDRARCFEYLMYGDEEEWSSEYMSAPHIREKLRMYFSYIREAFDDSTWPEMTSWEQKLSEYTELYEAPEDNEADDAEGDASNPDEAEAGDAEPAA